QHPLGGIIGRAAMMSKRVIAVGGQGSGPIVGRAGRKVARSPGTTEIEGTGFGEWAAATAIEAGVGSTYPVHRDESVAVDIITSVALGDGRRLVGTVTIGFDGSGPPCGRRGN